MWELAVRKFLSIRGAWTFEKTMHSCAQVYSLLVHTCKARGGHFVPPTKSNKIGRKKDPYPSRLMSNALKRNLAVRKSSSLLAIYGQPSCMIRATAFPMLSVRCCTAAVRKRKQRTRSGSSNASKSSCNYRSLFLFNSRKYAVSFSTRATWT